MQNSEVSRNPSCINVIVPKKEASGDLSMSQCSASVSPRPRVTYSDKECRLYLQRSKRCSSLGRRKSRVRSLSVGRNPEKDLRARYWAFLFENLYRAVDEIYQTCETDESIDESKEAILMLENYCKEFQALIQWLNISKKYEDMTSNRPRSLAWEVRKSLPCKASLKNTFLDKLASEGGRRKETENIVKIHSSVAVQTDTQDISEPDSVTTTSVECENLLVVVTPDAVPIQTSENEGETKSESAVYLVADNAAVIDEMGSEPACEIGISDKISEEKSIVLQTCSNSTEQSLTIDTSRFTSDAELVIAMNESNTECCGVSFLNPDDVLSVELNTNNNEQNKTEIAVENCVEENVKVNDPKLADVGTKPPDVKSYKAAALKKPPCDSSKPEIQKRNNPCVQPMVKKVTSTGNKVDKTKSQSGRNLQQKTNTTISTVSSNQTKFRESNAVTKPMRPLYNKVGRVDNQVKKLENHSVKSEIKTLQTAPKSTMNGTIIHPQIRVGPQPPTLQRSYTSLHSLKKNEHKTNSTLSLNSLASSKSWTGNVKRQSSNLGAVAKSNPETRGKDAEGWETVRGRARSKNSPAKILLKQAYAKNVVEQTRHSMTGGFPYNKQSSKGLSSTLKSKSTTSNEKQAQNNNKNNQNGTLNGTKKSNASSLADNHGQTRNIVDTAVAKSVPVEVSASNMTLLVTCESQVENGSISSNECILEPGVNDSNVNEVESLASKSVSLPNVNAVLVDKEISSDDACNLSTDENEQSTSSLKSVTSNGQTKFSDSSLVDGDEDEESKDKHEDTSSLEFYENMIEEEAQEQICELGLSWGDQMDLLDLESRTPGRALQMHEKLSSPFRKRSLSETIRRYEEKQLKAQELREKRLEEKAQRSKEIQKKVEEMKALSEKKQEQQRIILEQKLQRAEEKRKQQLEKIVKKAHDEEEKVNEIAFINTLEAQNKRHDLISKEKGHEARLQDIQDERQRKLEEKAAKEAAAEERRKVLEAERQAWLLEMQEKRKLKDLKIEQQLLEKEKERQELASQKARERELRLSALNAAQQATLEELQKKIQMKQEESARRHEENMEQIRQKAFELSVRRYSSNNDDTPKHVPYETKKICIICNILISSELYLLSHMRGKKHQEMIKDRHQGKDPSTEELELYNLKNIVDATIDQLNPNIVLGKERQKALKKRCKKLRQRMANRALEFIKASDKPSTPVSTKYKAKFVKIISQLSKYVAMKDTIDQSSVPGYEKVLIELGQIALKIKSSDKTDFSKLGGDGVLMDVLNQLLSPSSKITSTISKKIMSKACSVASQFFQYSFDNAAFVLQSNKIASALDLLNLRLNLLIPDNFSQVIAKSSSPVLPEDSVTGDFMQLIGSILDAIAKKKSQVSPGKEDSDESSLFNDKSWELRICDLVSYAVSISIVDKLSQYISNIQGPVNSEEKVATFLCHSMTFITSLVKLTSEGFNTIFEKKKEDSTQLLATFKVTDFVGALSLLYCILLHDGSPSLDRAVPEQLPNHTISLALHALRMLNYTAVLDLHTVQNMLGSEGLSLQLRHTVNYLLWYCNHYKCDDLLYETILLIGYFTVLNPENQVVIQSGQHPTILQQLSTLPFLFFSDAVLTEILFPTLISCCFNNDCNTAVLQQEVATELLAHYVEEKLLDLDSNKIGIDPNVRWRLPYRFPKHKWTAAKVYFAQKATTPSNSFP